MKVCTERGCEKRAKGRGLCSAHYERWRKRASSALCSVSDCGRTTYAKSLCSVHYDRLKKYGRLERLPEKPKVCTVTGCNETVEGRGYCHRHYRRVRKYGSAELPARPTECRVNGCGERHYSVGYCQSHYHRQYRSRHVDMMRAYAAAAKARRRRRGDMGMTEEDRRESARRRIEIADDPCFYCGEIAEHMQTDHMIPLSRGGTDHAENLVRACRACNYEKRTMTAEEYFAFKCSGKALP